LEQLSEKEHMEQNHKGIFQRNEIIEALQRLEQIEEDIDD
tara:strand:+ start:921 stop:1040 length:120 start_codon:yes stop_codon:yes gene_type:complete